MKEQQMRSERRWRRGGFIALVLAGAALVGSQPPHAGQWLADLPVWSWVLLAGAAGVMLRGGSR